MTASRIPSAAGWRALVAVALILLPTARAAELQIGTAQVSITPAEPVALAGQRHTRIAQEVESPVIATALALESRQGEEALDQAIIVTCDLVAIRAGLQQAVRARLEDQIADFDTRKLILTATHTHTGPVTLERSYILPAEGVLQPDDYVEWLTGRIATAAAEAWKNRRPGGVGWGLGHAVVARNRRAVYADGTAVMYGRTDLPHFRRLERYEDHAVDVLFFWNGERQLQAAAVNVACPAQEVEGRSAVNADFWHPVRQRLSARFGDLVTLGWIGAAGDQSPHLMYYQAAENRMRELRSLSPLDEIARRIERAVEEAHEGAAQDVRFEVPFRHAVQEIRLARRMVTDEEHAHAKSYCDAVERKRQQGEALDGGEHVQAKWYEETLKRYELQKEQPYYAMELHVLRLGDVAICTNPFELYTDYGIQIKARSKAIQTFVVQLACDSGAYLATEDAIRGGGYSAEIYSNIVSPEGGQQLVEHTVEAINALWE